MKRNDFSTSSTSWRRLQNVLEDEKLLHWKRLQDAFNASSPRWMFARNPDIKYCITQTQNEAFLESSFMK